MQKIFGKIWVISLCGWNPLEVGEFNHLIKTRRLRKAGSDFGIDGDCPLNLPFEESRQNCR